MTAGAEATSPPTPIGPLHGPIPHKGGGRSVLDRDGILTGRGLDLVDKQIAKAIFLCLWLLYASIGPGVTANNPNSAGRMGFIFSVIQQHTLTIDGFAPFV